MFCDKHGQLQWRHSLKQVKVNPILMHDNTMICARAMVMQCSQRTSLSIQHQRLMIVEAKKKYVLRSNQTVELVRRRANVDDWMCGQYCEHVDCAEHPQHLPSPHPAIWNPVMFTLFLSDRPLQGIQYQ